MKKTYIALGALMIAGYASAASAQSVFSSEEFAKAIERYTQQKEALSAQVPAQQTFEQRKSFLDSALVVLELRLKQLEEFVQGWKGKSEEGDILAKQLELNHKTLSEIRTALDKSKTPEDLQRAVKNMYTYRVVQEQTLNKAVLAGYVDRLEDDVIAKAAQRLDEFSKSVEGLDAKSSGISDLKALIGQARKEGEIAQATIQDLKARIASSDGSAEGVKKMEEGAQSIQKNVDAIYAILKQVALKGNELYKTKLPKAE